MERQSEKATNGGKEYNWRQQRENPSRDLSRSKSESTEGHRRSYNERSSSEGVCALEQTDKSVKNKPRVIRPMGFRQMENILKINDVEDVIFQIKDEKKGFFKLLESRDISANQIILIVKLLNKICNSNFSTSVVSLLEATLKSNFSETIETYISKIALQNHWIKEKNKFFWNEPDQFWTSILNICQKLHNLAPTSSCELTQRILHALKIYIPSIQTAHSIHISDEIKKNIDVLYDLIGKKIKEIENKKKLKVTTAADDEVEKPPDDFREISIYPSVGEITIPKEPFLRRNVIDKPYDTILHYLDVQYRLLREDFVRPLRIGISKYLSDNKAKLDDIKIHKHIRFLNAEIVNEQNCYRTQFDFTKRKKQFNYENSKRFMFGSLLCFTSDNFKSILFGKVARRDIKDLEKGQIIVGFDADIILPAHFYDTDFLMVESSVYFEPYYQVLNVLKNMEPIDFPMERYIIRVETDPKPPQYLLNNDSRYIQIEYDFSMESDSHMESIDFDMEPIDFPMERSILRIDCPSYIQIESERFCPLDWGTRRFYGLNDSQQAAFKAALTQEFAVIQGPPGTGKTFLGLKIAHTLIKNSHIWHNNSPMLVICYTNHALDQFLEGLLEVTDDIYRIGGQSKNEKLKEFNIKKKRNTYCSSTSCIIQIKKELSCIIEEISNINNILGVIDNNDTVLDFNIFNGFIKEFESSYFRNASDTEIYEWLFSGYDQRYNDNLINVQEESLVPYHENINNNEQEKEEAGGILETEEMGNKQEEIDDIFDIHDYVRKEACTALTSIKNLEEEIINTERALYILIENPDHDFQYEHMLRYELFLQQSVLQYLKMRLDEYANNPQMKPQFVDLQNPFNMDLNSRWHLYFYWLTMYVQKIKQRKENLSNEFKDTYRVYSEMRDMEDVQMMKNAKVIGMTTTGAARLRTSLQALKSPIVIVEEAAEVLEAHIVSSLTAHCRHLILIGDHQQLKPSTANFKIETEYFLGISLFERMIINKMQYHTLMVQHRMKPEISSLIHPLIYPDLEDHESVKDRPPILGIEKCLYFIDHQQMETMCNDNSKKNVHEAKFLIKLARHLILNDYKSENIVILVAYLGQMFEMQHLKKQESLLKDVRIAVLDNYQGEESDIILLSLVRSNPEKKIGFLKIENRVCVALSRARNGFYIMGNMTQLCESSEIWPNIKETLERQNAIGSHLTLQCQVHRYKLTQVKNAEDFSNFPEGGCDLLCKEILGCGHICKSFCHVTDRDHIIYKCSEKCTKILCENKDHICQRLCYETCGPCKYPVERNLACGHTVTIGCCIDVDLYVCKIPINVMLPCGHEIDKPCYKNIAEVRCGHPCENRIEPCGHACVRRCHINDDPDHLQYKCVKPCRKYRKGCSQKNSNSHLCTKLCYQDCEECEIDVQKARTVCPHMYTVPCKLDVDTIECKKRCTKILPCNHKCKYLCSEPCGNCRQKVEKLVSECNHKVQTECFREPTRNMCHGKCPRLLPCGHACGKKCNEDCRTRCKVLVDYSIPGPCGHIIKQVPCYLKNATDNERLLPYCNKKCEATLQCDHKCSGTCGECSQGRIHKRCMEQCKVPLICNHECPIPCRQTCQPCKKKCTYKCGHSKCPRNCGDPCVECAERCLRKCRHQMCTKRCKDICNVPPCNEPCTKNLKCGHQCAGFCGDICPKLCRICDEEEITDIFFGDEDEEGARFVMLEDCKHVFESTGLDKYFSQNDDTIKVLSCPKCKTTVRNSRRYSEYIKLMLKDIYNVKRVTNGSYIENEQLVQSLTSAIQQCFSQAKRFLDCDDFVKVVRKLASRLQPSKKNKRENVVRRQTIHKMTLNAIKAKVNILEAILAAFKTSVKLSATSRSVKLVTFILENLMRDEDSITDQEVRDIYREVDRLIRCVQLENIKNNISITTNSNVDTTVKIAKIESLLDTRQQYTHDLDNVLKEELQALKKIASSNIAITETERREIVQALKLTPGHWFKCQNGHPYIITECGGAMQVSRCNECGAPIGGRNHQLLHGTLAPEMDGARHVAWSEVANMQNYLF